MLVEAPDTGRVDRCGTLARGAYSAGLPLVPVAAMYDMVPVFLAGASAVRRHFVRDRCTACAAVPEDGGPSKW